METNRRYDANLAFTVLGGARRRLGEAEAIRVKAALGSAWINLEVTADDFACGEFRRIPCTPG